MSKAKVTDVDRMQAEIRGDLLTVMVPCKAKGEFHFAPGVKVLPIAKAIGITSPTLDAFARGSTVSLTTLSKIRAYLDGLRESAETA